MLFSLFLTLKKESIMSAKTIIESGKAILGIEFGSTRIKAVLIDTDNNPIADRKSTRLNSSHWS